MLVGLVFDTSIETSNGDRVHNVGMMNDRLAIIILGAALFIGGILLKAKAPANKTATPESFASHLKELSKADIAYRLASTICAVLITAHPLIHLFSSGEMAYLLGAATFGFIALRRGHTPSVLRRFWSIVLLFEFFAVIGFAYSFLIGGSYVYRTIYSVGESFDVFSPTGAFSIYIAAPFAITLIAYVVVRKMK